MGKNERKTQKGLNSQLLLTIAPTVVSVIASVVIMYNTNNMQSEIAESNLELQNREYELTKSESYPAFEFLQEDLDDGTRMYYLNKDKGEMNNVDFTVFGVITGVAKYKDLYLDIEQTIHTRSVSRDKFNYKYIGDIDISLIEERLTKLCSDKGIDIEVNGLSEERVYKVSYMNFQHEYREEYYRISSNGAGRAINYLADEKIPSFDRLGIFGGRAIDYEDSNQANDIIAQSIFYNIETQKDYIDLKADDLNNK